MKHNKVQFVKEGETVKRRADEKFGILDQADDWKMVVDLDKKLTFPEIISTNLRPDMVLCSPGTKIIIVKELTVPWEERCSEAHERKKTKYDTLLRECRK